MKLKANLHFHTGDDPYETIEYSTPEAIDRAADLGFGAIALTCHRYFAWKKEYADYAASRNVLLIPGIEANIDESRDIWGRHVLVLNCDKDAEQLRTFEDLEAYKKSHPQVFIIAPHPYYYGYWSLKEYLEKYIGLFDAIEQSWFYSRWFNRNRRAEAIAQKYNLPFIATSDTHYFDFLNTSYAIIETKEKTIPAVFEAIRQKSFVNVTSPRSFWKDMLWGYGGYSFKKFLQTGQP